MNRQKKLDNIRGCLTGICTPDSVAKRRSPLGESDHILYRNLPPYRIDTIKIRGSLAFARLPGKSEVFIIPEHPHVGTRLSHTLGIVNTGVAIGNILGLNIDLIEAGTSGHDIGHAAFGHIGEEALKAECNIVFRHEIFGCVVAQQLENLNLTQQTLLCIRWHSRGKKGMETNAGLSPESTVVMLADKIYYIWTNIVDAFGGRTNIPFRKLPTSVQRDIAWFGPNCQTRILRTITEACLESAEVGYPSFTTSPAATRFAAIKTAMYEYVYNSQELDLFRYGDREKAKQILRYLHDHTEHPVPFFALMTDREAITMADIIERGRKINLKRFSAYEILSHHHDLIDVSNPDLDW